MVAFTIPLSRVHEAPLSITVTAALVLRPGPPAETWALPSGPRRTVATRGNANSPTTRRIRCMVIETPEGFHWLCVAVAAATLTDYAESSYPLPWGDRKSTRLNSSHL